MKKRVLLFIMISIILIFNPIQAIVVKGITGKSITGDTITGKASSEQTNVSIYITVPIPLLNITRPKNHTYLTNHSILLNFTSSYGYLFWYSIDGRPNVTIVSGTYFNTSAGSHVLYLYSNNTDGIINYTKVYFIVNLTKLIINYSDYKGANKGESIDFYSFSYEELNNISGLILEDILYGKMEFLEDINVTDLENKSDNVLDINRFTEISYNNIMVDSDRINNFNKSSRIYLYNLSFTNPRILRNGIACSINYCTIDSYSSSVLRFNVNGFTNYSLDENPNPESISRSGGERGETGISKLFENENTFGNILIDLKCDLLKDEFFENDDVVSNITISKDYNQTIIVVMKYGILDIDNNWIVIVRENLTLDKDKMNILKSLKIPKNIKPGKYYYITEIKYLDQSIVKKRSIDIKPLEVPQRVMNEINNIVESLAYHYIAIISIIVIFFIVYFSIRFYRLYKRKDIERNS